jgi:PAS domain S-box-containing protein
MNRYRPQAVAIYLSRSPKADYDHWSHQQFVERIRELEIERIEMELQREDALRQGASEQEVRVPFGQRFYDAPVSLFILSRDGKVMDANRLGARMLLGDGTSVRHRNFSDVVSKESLNLFSQFLLSVFQNTVSSSCEIVLQSKGRPSSYVKLSGIAAGPISDCMVAVSDISEQRQLRLSLEKSVNNFQNMFNQHHAVMLLVDPESSAIIDANASAARFYGYDIPVLQTMKMESIEIAAEEPLSGSGVRAKVYPENKNVLQHRLAGGELRTVEVYSSPVEFDGRQLFFFIINNITDRRQAELSLRKSEEKYRGLVLYSNDPIFSFNRDETYRFVNEAFAKPFGKKPDEIIGLKPHSIFSQDEAEKRLTIIRGVFVSGVKKEIEVKVVTQSGDTRYFLTMADPIKNDEGVVLYVSCISKDITERKTKEIEREHLITELQNAIEHIKTLKGIVPICSSCKNIRDDEGFWEQVESYVQKHTDAQFSHSLCPNCVEKYFPKFKPKE